MSSWLPTPSNEHVVRQSINRSVPTWSLLCLLWSPMPREPSAVWLSTLAGGRRRTIVIAKFAVQTLSKLWLQLFKLPSMKSAGCPSMDQVRWSSLETPENFVLWNYFTKIISLEWLQSTSWSDAFGDFCRSFFTSDHAHFGRFWFWTIFLTKLNQFRFLIESSEVRGLLDDLIFGAESFAGSYSR